MALELESLLNNRNATATLILPPRFNAANSDNPFIGRPRPVVGIITNANFVIGGSNTFSSPISQSQLDSFNEKNKFLGRAGELNSAIVNRQIVSGLSTIKSWDASSDFKFSLDITFIATTSRLINDVISGTDNVVRPCLELLSLVFPTVGEASQYLFSYFAPGGYAPPLFNDSASQISGEDERAINGTVQIAVGNWLRLRNMVCDSLSCSFSREIQRNGTPLYATVSMEFSCYRTYTYSDIIQIFNQNMGVDLSSNLFTYADKQSENKVLISNAVTDNLINFGNSAIGTLVNTGDDIINSVTDMIPGG